MSVAVKTASVSVMEITPSVAAEMLARNHHNRSIRRSRVVLFAGAMARGEWRMSNDALAFDTEGKLLNGQHRLRAVVQSGVTIEALVMMGLPSATQETMDTGAKRTAGDMLKLRGYTNVNNLAATTRLVLVYRLEQRINPKRGNELTVPQILAFVEDHAGLTEAVNIGKRVRGQLAGSPSMWAAVYYLASEVDPADAAMFFDRLIVGTAPVDGEPIHQLRKAVLADAVRSRRADSTTMAAWAIKAFNAWRRGEQIYSIRWRRGGANAEAFPALLDYPEYGSLSQ